MGSREAEETRKETYAQIMDQLRVFCLTERSDSVLMWSHYAQNHSGIVLGFDFNALEKSLDKPIRAVRYPRGDLPQIVDYRKWNEHNLFGVNHDTLVQENSPPVPLIKHEDWEYEAEWRVLMYLPKREECRYRDVPFAPKSLVEVVAGCRTDMDVFGGVRHLANRCNPEVNFFQMEQVHQKLQFQKKALK